MPFEQPQTNPTVLITGYTDGLGKLLAINLAKRNFHIIIHGRNQDKAQAVIEELKAINPKGKYETIICDFNKPQEIADKFGKINTLDILINNAGVWAEGNTVDITPERIIELVNVNLLACLIVTRVLLPVLKKSNFGQILNVSSIGGVELPSGYFHTIYTATKFGVQAFSEALAKEFDNSNIRVMGYYPGGMNTKFFKKSGFDYKENEPWMFDPQESVDAMIFMLTRNPKVNVKRLDLINHLQ
ncbi:SDR family NAD(P)-dependent oxidoreductase [Candidatus Dojkabacteria bacterium]|nr:SDR family NAD(P)-dependent oxidoreductase [Candidatus Dojkabacteria bacterium]